MFAGGNADCSHSGFLNGYISLSAAKARIEELVKLGKIIP
jgi:hypothetical protein